MIDFTPNSPATIYISLVNQGAPLVGATVTVSISDPNGNSLVTSQAATDEGTGTYSYTLAYTLTGTIGTYTATWVVTNPLNLTQITTFLVDYETLTSLTVADLRQRIGEMIEGEEGFQTGVAQGGSTTTSLFDPYRQEPDNQWKGGWLLIYAGTGAGQQARITASSQSATTLTLAPSLAVTPDATSRYEIHQFFNRDSFLRAIRTVVREVAHWALVPVQSTLMTVVAQQYEYPVPPGWSHLYEVQIQMKNFGLEGDGHWRPVAPGAVKINRASRTFTIPPTIVYNNTTKPMRLQGLRPPTDPLDDNSPIDVRANYVLHAAAAHLCSAKALLDQDKKWAALLQYHTALAQQEKLQIPRVPNNTRRLDY